MEDIRKIAIYIIKIPARLLLRLCIPMEAAKSAIFPTHWAHRRSLWQIRWKPAVLPLQSSPSMLAINMKIPLYQKFQFSDKQKFDERIRELAGEKNER